MRRGQVRIGCGRISYTESSGKGPGALLVHGNSGSVRTFERQLDSELGRSRRLVAIDLPSHGDSDRLPAGDDPLSGLAVAIAEAATALDLAQGVYFGHSLGGHLILEAAALGQLRGPRGVAISGCPPVATPGAFAEATYPHAEGVAAFMDDPTEAQTEALLRLWFSPHVPPSQIAREDFHRTEPTIRGRIGAAVMTARLRDELAALRALPCPVALLHGADDPLLRESWMREVRAPNLWRGALQVIPNAGHFAPSEQAEAFNALLAAFLDDVYGA